MARCRSSRATPPAYDLTDSVASAGASTLLTGQVLGTGVIVVNASSDLLSGNDVAADATVNDLNLDRGLALLRLLQVDATVIQSTARISGACGSMTATGTSTLAGLTIDVRGLPPIIIPLNPPANFVLLDALGIRIVLNQQIATGDGITKRGLTVNALRITLNNASFTGGLGLGAVVNGDIISASSHAEHDCEATGTCACDMPAPVESSAFGETVNLNLLPGLGQGILINSGKVPAVAGEGPPAYDKTASVTTANVSTALTGSILSTGVVAVNATGNAAGNTAASDATVNGLNLNVVGLLQALSLDSTLVQSTANVSGDCGSFTTTGTSTFANASANVLGIGHLTIVANPAPNTVLLDSQLLGIKIVLNEQIGTRDGVNTRGLIVNAIHIYLNDVDIAGIGIVTGDIVIAQSKAQRNCGGGCVTP